MKFLILYFLAGTLTGSALTAVLTWWSEQRLLKSLRASTEALECAVKKHQKGTP
jgi:formate/nitrite transporter FocA (FNT family)